MGPHQLLLFALCALGLGTACCPVPLYRSVSLHPELSLTVTSASGAHVPGASITVRRYISGPPPDTETHRWTNQTDTSGALRMPAIEQSEAYMPLMMHGVNWYSWQICAEHPTLGVASQTVHAAQPVQPPVAIALVLDPARSACGWSPMSAP